MATEQSEESFFRLLLVVRSYKLLGFSQIFRSQFSLHIYETFHEGLILFV